MLGVFNFVVVVVVVFVLFFVLYDTATDIDENLRAREEEKLAQNKTSTSSQASSVCFPLIVLPIYSRIFYIWHKRWWSDHFLRFWYFEQVVAYNRCFNMEV